MSAGAPPLLSGVVWAVFCNAAVCMGCVCVWCRLIIIPNIDHVPSDYTHTQPIQTAALKVIGLVCAKY